LLLATHLAIVSVATFPLTDLPTKRALLWTFLCRQPFCLFPTTFWKSPEVNYLAACPLPASSVFPSFSRFCCWSDRSKDSSLQRTEAFRHLSFRMHFQPSASRCLIEFIVGRAFFLCSSPHADLSSTTRRCLYRSPTPLSPSSVTFNPRTLSSPLTTRASFFETSADFRSSGFFLLF